MNDEFNQNYFCELNKILEIEYENGLVRPDKELIFNALNSIKPSQVMFIAKIIFDNECSK